MKVTKTVVSSTEPLPKYEPGPREFVIRFRVSTAEFERIERAAEKDKAALTLEWEKRGLAGNIEMGAHEWARAVVLEAARRKTAKEPEFAKPKLE